MAFVLARRRALRGGIVTATAGGLAACGRLPLLADGGGPPPDRLAPGGPGFMLYEARHEDTLIELARAFRLGYVELAAANPGVDPWLPGEGTMITVPTARIMPRGPRDGLLINLADMRLYHFRKDAPPAHYPIGIGRQGHRTPHGSTRVLRKAVLPTWRPPPAVRAERPELPAVVPPGPENPLGSHALYLGWPAYLIHGTNIPWSVGRHASNGCIRLYPENIGELHDEVSIGTSVRVVDEPIKLGWVEDVLYMEAHPSQAQADQLEETRWFAPEKPAGLETRVRKAAGAAAGRIDWEAVTTAVALRRCHLVRIMRA